MADVAVDPQQYMNHSSMRIVIKEANPRKQGDRRQLQNNQPEVSSSVEEEHKILISEPPQDGSEEENSETEQADQEHEEVEKQVGKKNHSNLRNPKNSYTRSSSGDLREERQSLKPTRSTSNSTTVNLDPEPRSTTVLSKSASTPSQLNKNLASEGGRTSKVGNVRDRYQPNNSKSDSKSTLVRAKENLGYAVPKRYPLLPADVKERFDRYTYLPGVKTIPSNTLEWKVPLLQRKNQQVIQDFLNTLFVEQQKKDAERKLRDQERIEREKLEATPEWKRPLVRVKEEKRKLEQSRQHERQEQEKLDKQKFQSLPPWQQELILRKKEKERLEKLPEWQRDLIQKKKVAQTKKSFERME